MEHDEKPLPIDIRLLGALAEKVCIIYSLVKLDWVLLSFSHQSIHSIYLVMVQFPTL